METKHRTLLQASVLLILLVCAVASNRTQEKPAQVAEQVAATE
jgi:outer membrane biogenesis lipoprotein LolB